MDQVPMEHVIKGKKANLNNLPIVVKWKLLPFNNALNKAKNKN